MIKNTLLLLALVTQIGQVKTTTTTTPATLLEKPVPTTLVCDKEKILYHRLVPAGIVLDKNALTNKIEEKIQAEHISYLYISNTAAPPEPLEDITKRSLNAQFFKLPKKTKEEPQQWKARVYTDKPYYHDDATSEWYATEWADITELEFDKQTKESAIASFILDYAVATETSMYTDSLDGSVGFYDENWNAEDNYWYDVRHYQPWTGIGDYTAYPTGVGAPARATWVYPYGFYQQLWVVDRLFFPFDTSLLPDTATVTAADFKFNVYAETNEYISMVLTDQSVTLLTPIDWTKMTIDNPGTGANDLYVSTTGDKTWSLNATGLGWIDVEGWTKLGVRDRDCDVNNVKPSGQHYVGIYFSEQSGTAEDPYIEITYTLPTTTTTVGATRRIMLIQ